MHRALLALPTLLASFSSAFPYLGTEAQIPAGIETTPSEEWHSLPSGAQCLLEQLEKKTLPTGDALLDKYADKLLVRIRSSSRHADSLLKQSADILELDVWEATSSWLDILLEERDLCFLSDMIKDDDRKYTVLMSGRDLARAVDDQYPHRDLGSQERVKDTKTSQELRPRSQGTGVSARQENNMFFNDYQPLSVIEPWMRLLSSLFNTHVRMVTIGKSFEGRPISAFKVGVHPTNDDTPQVRKTILVSGGSHAREWVGVSTVNYIAYSFITGYGKNQMITKLLESFDFIFIPTINPDGYEHTWTTDRLWRKNRQPTSSKYCHGIDLDRSFGFQWGSSPSGSPCSESYGGSQAFEATESKAYADWALNEVQNSNVSFVGFLELHSYSESILYPYSYSCTAMPPGLENLQELAYRLERAIRISGGHAYGILPACEGNTLASKDTATGTDENPWSEENGGSALDFFYHELKIPYAYQIKLRDRGTYGFLLPKNNIVPTGKETLDAVIEMARFLNTLYGPESEPDVKLEKPKYGSTDTHIESESRETAQLADETKRAPKVKLDLAHNHEKGKLDL
ncbi:hypothetical protein K431DRAFT_284683 [Polychaeton citri CBS 116435]|uniref:Inactive metallocarboxypeptidase ECM14 n=1 Tax=Polychaeton citri CBS 116435 TaxID=1314669 RepID=A0A9P4QBR8_9PEZI|nr:hypothetical protein K431DRAFT_284683 [Polychaeton citri CBS 116435]